MNFLIQVNGDISFNRMLLTDPYCSWKLELVLKDILTSSIIAGDAVNFLDKTSHTSQP